MASDGLEKITEVPYEFVKEGQTFIQRCKKPDGPGTLIEMAQIIHCVHEIPKYLILIMCFAIEFLQIVRAVGVGFVVMGAIGYFVKLVCVMIYRELIALASVLRHERWACLDVFILLPYTNI